MTKEKRQEAVGIDHISAITRETVSQFFDDIEDNKIEGDHLFNLNLEISCAVSIFSSAMLTIFMRNPDLKHDVVLDEIFEDIKKEINRQIKIENH